MIHPRVVIDFITAEPFRAFRIHMASGRSFEIRHPEMARVGRSSMTVFMTPEKDDSQQERWQEVSLMLLEFVEPLNKTQSSSPGESGICDPEF
jgi:hypothetical protein